MTTTIAAAERPLLELGITEPREIDVDVIAWHLGAKVRYRPLLTCEARIIGREDRAIITVDDRKPRERQRFSVAHELGHWHYHRGRCLICRSEEIGNGQLSDTNPERVADRYASELLMPRYIFDPIVRSHSRLDVAVLRKVKSMFDVSLTAIALRALRTNRFPVVFMCHGPDGKRRWFRRPPCVPERWFPRDELDQDSFAFDMLFGSAVEQARPRIVGADAWFDRPEAKRYDVLEHSYRLPNGEIATLVLIEGDAMLQG